MPELVLLDGSGTISVKVMEHALPILDVLPEARKLRRQVLGNHHKIVDLDETYFGEADLASTSRILSPPISRRGGIEGVQLLTKIAINIFTVSISKAK